MAIKMFIFPCGSEVGLEIHRSLRYSRHIELIGGSSVSDHGQYLYANYISGIPFVDSTLFIAYIKQLVSERHIDAIYPATDKVVWKLKGHESELGCKVIASPFETVSICVSKEKTYAVLQDNILVPKLYKSLAEVENYPIFMKPDDGHSSIGAFRANSKEESEAFLESWQLNGQKMLILENLPGPEYTVDCFTNRKGELLFAGARHRSRILNGISVYTYPVEIRQGEYLELARKINSLMRLQGAWFFQVKENSSGELVLLEVASRLGGSSGLYRNLGINFALLSIFDFFGYDVAIQPSVYPIEMDRPLSNRFRLELEYKVIYVDLDDCVIINDQVNTEIISFLYQALNRGKRIILMTKHSGNVQALLSKYRLTNLFDEIIHLNPEEEKSDYISEHNAIFIDDSFKERSKVRSRHGIAVFSPDMVESLIT